MKFQQVRRSRTPRVRLRTATVWNTWLLYISVVSLVWTPHTFLDWHLWLQVALIAAGRSRSRSDWLFTGATLPRSRRTVHRGASLGIRMTVDPADSAMISATGCSGQRARRVAPARGCRDGLQGGTPLRSCWTAIPRQRARAPWLTAARQDLASPPAASRPGVKAPP